MSSVDSREPGEGFGGLLQYYRQRTHDPEQGGHLTQVRLADLADCGITGTMVGHWETGRRTIRHQDRLILCSLVRVLHQYGGIATLSEANELLETGLYSQLVPEEIQEIDPDWLKAQREDISPTLPHSPIIVILSPKTFYEWLDSIFR